MFDSKHVPCYLDGVSIRQEKLKGDDYKVADLLFRIEPMTPKLAGEIGDAVKSTLFRRNDAEVVTHIRSAVFDSRDLGIKPQAIEVRSDPKVPMAFELDECRLANLKARKPKDDQQWVFFFTASVTQLDGATLLAVTEGLYRQWFLSFENAVAGLFDEEEKAKRKARGRANAGEAEAAAATH